MDYSKITEEIMEKGFFSEYLPKCFNLDKKVFRKTPVEKGDLIAPYAFTMSRYNGNDARRTLYIPEIGAYIVAANYIREKGIIKEIVEFTKKSKHSFSPVLGKDGTIMWHEQSYDEPTEDDSKTKSDYIDNIAKKIIMASGAKFVLKLDISNCFPSFYMHMIPAILLGVDEATKEFNKTRKSGLVSDANYEKYSGLDKVIRKQNLNRTNGLLPGMLMSKIIAEGILCRIDLDLAAEGVKFARYVDDYEVYIYGEEEETTISIFTRVLKKYGFSLNYEKTEKLPFPYYVVNNLEKIFGEKAIEESDKAELMNLFNTFFTFEINGTKGAIRYMLKSLEKTPIKPKDPTLYKAYLLTIISNNERALTKGCSLLIENKETLRLDNDDVAFILKLLEKHIKNQHDMESLWLLHLLISTEKIDTNPGIISLITDSPNELAHIMLLRKDLLTKEAIDKVIASANSWILLYELYSGGYIDENVFFDKLGLNHYKEVYKGFKEENIHFCEME